MLIRAAILFTVLLLGGLSMSAQDLVRPANDAPQYQLSNVRTERDRFGKNVILVDFRRTREGKGSVTVGGRSDNQSVTVSASVPSGQASGTLRLGSLFGMRSELPDLELFFQQSHRIGASEYLNAKVSNSVNVGNSRSNANPREWTNQEREKAAEFERIMSDDSAHKPDKTYKVSIQPQDGFEFVSNTVKVGKGTRLYACFQHTWHPLTTLSENDDGTINVRWDKFSSSRDCAMNRGELTIASDLVANLPTHPASRFPPTIPNWESESAKTTLPPSADALQRKSYPVSVPIPLDSERVSDDLALKQGVPLQACWANKWNPLTAISENEDRTVNVHWNDFGSSSDCSMVRSELIIKKSIAEQLRSNPDSYKPSIAPLRRKTYTVSIPVPPDSEYVPNGVELESGTKLQACYARRWNPITLLSNASDGSLNVRWDDYGKAFDCSMLRSELIIKKSELHRQAGAMSDDQYHLFTDSTGRFKVQAKVASQTGTDVTLVTDKGKTVTLPLSRLSQPDQDYLRNLSENPFE